MGRIIHFEIHAEEPKRAAEFYEKLFGWKFTTWGAQTYWVIDTGEGSPGINGGMMRRKGPPPADGQAMNGFVNIIEVADIDEHIKRIAAAGGTMVIQRQTVEGMGYSAYFRDTEGNIVGIFQALPASTQ